MIGSDKGLRKVCRNYELVENYLKAIVDETQVWQLHHRREIDEMKSMQQLKDEGKYYDVDPSELIFLSIREHTKLHSENMREEIRKKISENNARAMLGKHHTEEARKKMSEALKGENHPLYGKQHTASTKKKMSDAQKGKFVSEETRKKMSDAKKGENHPQFGWHWWNNGKVSIKSKECPGEGFVKGRLKWVKSSKSKIF